MRTSMLRSFLLLSVFLAAPAWAVTVQDLAKLTPAQVNALGPSAQADYAGAIVAEIQRLSDAVSADVAKTGRNAGDRRVGALAIAVTTAVDLQDALQRAVQSGDKAGAKKAFTGLRTTLSNAQQLTTQLLGSIPQAPELNDLYDDQIERDASEAGA